MGKTTSAQPLEIKPLEIAFSGSIPFDFEFHAAPAAIADLVNTFYVIRSDAREFSDMMPAYSAQLMVFVEGSAQLERDGGGIDHSQPVTCTAPLLQAMPVSLSGPVLIAGASLTPLGWHCVSRSPVDATNNRMIPADTLLDADEIALLAKAGGGQSRTDWESAPVFRAIETILSGRRPYLRADHVRFVGDVTRWLSSDLNPAVVDLHAFSPLSERTVQRLSRRYFGASPTALSKRYRAIRAAMLLANDALPQAQRDEILEGYFDQAHLIRDIKRYTGRTPTMLKGTATLANTLEPDAHGAGAALLKGAATRESDRRS